MMLMLAAVAYILLTVGLLVAFMVRRHQGKDVTALVPFLTLFLLIDAVLVAIVAVGLIMLSREIP